MKLFFAVLLFFSLATPALAAEPMELSYTTAQTVTLPYNFTPRPIIEPPNELPINFVNVDFINNVGSYALTVFTILDQYQVLAIFVVIMLALSALWWLYTFVTGKPARADTLELSSGLDRWEELETTEDSGIPTDWGYIPSDDYGEARNALEYIISNSRKLRF